jgi:hypothetical protein
VACSSSEPQVSNNTEQSSKQAGTVTAPTGQSSKTTVSPAPASNNSPVASNSKQIPPDSRVNPFQVDDEPLRRCLISFVGQDEYNKFERGDINVGPEVLQKVQPCLPLYQQIVDGTNNRGSSNVSNQPSNPPPRSSASNTPSNAANISEGTTKWACNGGSVSSPTIDFKALEGNRIGITLAVDGKLNGFRDITMNFMPRSNPQISYVPTKHSAFNETKGFALHEYVAQALSVGSAYHEIDVPKGVTPFQMGYKVDLIGNLENGVSCSTTLFSYLDRPASMFPASNLSVPLSMLPDYNKWSKYANKMPAPSAEAVILATHNGTWQNDRWELGRGVEKYLLNDVPMRIGLYGDVALEDYETIRDSIEIYKIITPSREMSFATEFNQVSLPFHLVDCTEIINIDDEYCNPNGPSGAFSSPRFMADQARDGSLFHKELISNYYGYINLSRQRINRHTLAHEFMHAMGSPHTNCRDTSMGPPDAQASFHAAHDLMTIAAIHHPAVKNNSSTEQMRAALGIPNDAKWKSLLANPQLACGPTDSFWVNFAAEIEQEWLATHVLEESKLR